METRRLTVPEQIDRRAIVSHPRDNVATTKSCIVAGTELLLSPNGEKLRVREPIPSGHKFSLCPIPKGRPVIKYGEKIGKAIRLIEPGEWVHTHNIEGLRGKRK
jgi:altronate dehydratase